MLTLVFGLIMASAFPAILVFAHELLPGRVGLVSGMFFGFSVGRGGLGAAAMRRLAGAYGIAVVYNIPARRPEDGRVVGVRTNRGTGMRRRADEARERMQDGAWDRKW